MLPPVFSVNSQKSCSADFYVLFPRPTTSSYLTPAAHDQNWAGAQTLRKASSEKLAVAAFPSSVTTEPEAHTHQGHSGSSQAPCSSCSVQ